MKWLIKRCKKCGGYTLNDDCPKCGSETYISHPPKYSLQDRYAKYKVLSEKENRRV